MPNNSRMLMAATRLMEAPANVASVRSVGIFLRQQRHTGFPSGRRCCLISSGGSVHNLRSGCQAQN